MAPYGPAREINALAELSKGLEVEVLVGVFIYIHTLCMRSAKAHASLRMQTRMSLC